MLSAIKPFCTRILAPQTLSRVDVSLGNVRQLCVMVGMAIKQIELESASQNNYKSVSSVKQRTTTTTTRRFSSGKTIGTLVYGLWHNSLFSRIPDNKIKLGSLQSRGIVSVTFLKPDGKKITVKGNEDKSLYDAVIDNNVDIDGFGACEGTLCCTTCHLIFKQSDYEKVGGPSDEELDMLDLAYGLTDTSRLGCQVILRKELDPLEVQVPASINDIREN